MGWRCTVTTPTGGGPEGKGCAVADVANIKTVKKNRSSEHRNCVGNFDRST